MAKLSTLELHPPKILLMGTFGTGKTLLATSVGKRGRILDLNNGLLSARTFKDDHTKTRGEIDVKTCWEQDPFKALAFEKVRSYVESMREECYREKNDYDTLIIDGYTDLAEFAVRNVMDANGMIGKNPQIQHWGLAFQKIKWVLTVLKSLPINLIVIAHTRRVEDEGVSTYELATPGTKLPAEVPTYFDEIWFMQVKGSGAKREFVVRTQPTSLFPAKTRTQVPDNQLASLGMNHFLKQIQVSAEESKNA